MDILFYILSNLFDFLPLLQLLWISDDGIPDLGGINEEDTCFIDEVNFYYIEGTGRLILN